MSKSTTKASAFSSLSLQSMPGSDDANSGLLSINSQGKQSSGAALISGNVKKSVKLNMKKNFSRKLLFIACLSGLGLAGQAYAGTYYVSSSGSDSNSGSQSSPFKTINKGLSRATSSGDIVYVMSGTYPEMVYVGQSGIKLLAYPNNTPVIDGQGWLPNKDWGSLISVAGN